MEYLNVWVNEPCSQFTFYAELKCFCLNILEENEFAFVFAVPMWLMFFSIKSGAYLETKYIYVFFGTGTEGRVQFSDPRSFAAAVPALVLLEKIKLEMRDAYISLSKSTRRHSQFYRKIIVPCGTILFL